MKKHLLITILLFGSIMLSSQLSAQTEKGNMLLGGSVNFSYTDNDFDTGSSTNDISTNTSLNINPSFGYFIADNFVVGANIGLSFFSSESDSGNLTTSSNGVTFGPFARYYTDSGLFGTVGFGFGSSNFEQESDFGDADFTSSTFSWNIGVGYAIFLNESIAIEPLISYNRSVSDPNTDVGDERNILSSINVGAGFNIYFNK
ncbi:MAG: outer membrane beta-barrel protein [Bacteroidota bacterium]